MWGSINSRYLFQLIIAILLIASSVPSGISGLSVSEDEFDPFFSFTISVPYVPGDRLETVHYIAEELLKIGIEVKVDAAYITFITRRTFDNTKIPILSLTEDPENGYDAAVFTWSADEDNFHYIYPPAYPPQFTTFDKEQFDFLFNVIKTNENPTNYTDKEFNDFHASYVASHNLSHGQEHFEKIQRKYHEDVPVLGILAQQSAILSYQDYGYDHNMLQAALMSQAPSLWESVTNSDGSNIRFATLIDSAISTFFDLNPLDWANPLTTPVFQPLYENTLDDKHTWTPLLASSMPVWNENYTQATISLKQNVSFGDGHLLDAWDVKNTYDWWMTMPDSGRKYDLNQYLQISSFFNSTDDVNVIDDHTIKFSFRKPYINSMNLLSQNIVPLHLWGTPDNCAYCDINRIIHFDLLINGTSKYGVGTGPFQYSNLTLSPDGGSTSLIYKKSINYWNGEVETPQLEHILMNDKKIGINVSNGDLDFAYYILASRQIDIENLVNTELSYHDIGSYVMMMFNLNHPYYGTGVALNGTHNLETNEEAARNIRVAINYALPRDAVISLYYGDYAKSVALPMSSEIYGINNSYQLISQNLTKAKEHMELAGFDLPEDQETTSSEPLTTSTPSSTNNGFLSYNIWIVPIMLWATYKVHSMRRCIKDE